ncbi:hypothetical protein EZS27_000716 [termite gut metagenome]|uniref:Uncharacterized protein n=1 Tax=termite gut metagenome TaxID=433724 RepID=A0A5J4T0E5_9ZZZZ
MKRLLILLFLVSFIVSNGASQFAFDYGLFFNSHSVRGDQRTSLVLERGDPISFEGNMEISFDMEIRNEALFGTILHIKFNKTHVITLLFIASETEKNHPALAIDEKIYAISNKVERKEGYFSVSISLLPEMQKLFLKYDDIKQTIPIELETVNEVSVLFGANFLEKQTDSAPVNVKDIKIFNNNKLIRYWELKQHNENICYDKIHKIPAIANNPHWIINDHIEWKEIYRSTNSEIISLTFDPKGNVFYILKGNNIAVYDPVLQKETLIPVKDGYPAINYPGHLLYDTLSNCLVSYCLHKKEISTFSFKNNSWSKKTENTDEMHYQFPALAYQDSIVYTFGGYGFYTFKNDLFKINLASGEFEQFVLNDINPRFASSAAIVGNVLYVLGGKGNKQGRQAFSSQQYNELYTIDLKTLQTEKVHVFEDQDGASSFVLAPSMYFDSSDSSLYAINLHKGGILMKISLHDYHKQNISKPISSAPRNRNQDFDLFYSQQLKKMFLVFNGIVDNQAEIVIYSLNFPIINEEELLQTNEEEGSGRIYALMGVGGFIVCLVVLGMVLLWRRRKRKSKEEIMFPDYDSASDENETLDETLENETIKYFDRSKSAISLLGGFNVRDNKGNDITSFFTPKLKGLLIVLIIYTTKDPRGILVKKIDDILWPDKDEEAARNNRNVTLRKLRVLFETIGDMMIINDNGFLRIKLEDTIFCDYTTALQCIEKMGQQKEIVNTEVLDQLLELQLYGTLLPNTTRDWLDDFKDNYSGLSIDLLKKLLITKKALSKKQLLDIANTLFLHDPLNETALTVKCSVFFQSGKTGIAKNVYDKFCNEYKRSLATNYTKPFSDYCK